MARGCVPRAGLEVSIVVFTVLVTLMSLGLGLLMTLVGLPILLGTAYVNRRFADAERWRAGFLVRERIGRRYRDGSGRRFWHRLRVVATDPQTWKDYAWLMVLCVVGFAFGVRAPTIAACSRCSRTSARPAED